MTDTMKKTQNYQRNFSELKIAILHHHVFAKPSGMLTFQPENQEILPVFK